MSTKAWFHMGGGADLGDGAQAVPLPACDDGLASKLGSQDPELLSLKCNTPGGAWELALLLPRGLLCRRASVLGLLLRCLGPAWIPELPVRLGVWLLPNPGVR